LGLPEPKEAPDLGMSCYPIGKGYVPLIAMLNELRAIAVERRSPERSSNTI
jgi:hypothetical protein